MISVAVTSLITQIARIAVLLNADTIIEQCPFLVIALGIIIKETNYVIHEQQLRIIFESIFEDWIANRPKSELDIMEKYAKRGLFFGRLYVANGCFCYVTFTLVAIAPRVLDILSPKNESRGVGFIYPAYYALDEEEYYYLIMGHMISVITVVFLVYISCDSIYMAIVQHACGLLSVSGYRFMGAIESNLSRNTKDDGRTINEVYQRVCHSVKAHQHAMDYIKGIDRIHETYLFIAVALVMLSFSITLVKTAYLVSFPNVDGAVNGMPYYIAAAGAFLKMGNYFTDEFKLKSMLNHIFNDWAAIESKEEYEIMISYSRRGTLSAIGYLVHIFFPLICFTCFIPVPPILDILLPLNESRNRIFIYPAYYWVDNDQHYLLIIAHMIVIAYSACFIYCACDANYVYAVQHACALLAVTKHRFKNVNNNLPAHGTRYVEKVKYKNVCHSIQAHQRALKYLDLIENNHHTYLFISMGMLITAVSVSLLKVSNGEHGTQWIVHCAFSIALLFHIFVLTVQGQFVINALQEVYYAICESAWYKCSPKTQALYVLILRSCLNPPLLTAGGMITLNLRSFAEIIKACVSYYTVMQTK
ncbi:uncharacterized protein LOC143425704 [Xylocopa sonorina]|uniref:uncharacterized protein LOC143425704 n=1 Tax=Xylocopa sonorina TaxID=1818115 RepID=UPI00403AF009